MRALLTPSNALIAGLALLGVIGITVLSQFGSARKGDPGRDSPALTRALLWLVGVGPVVVQLLSPRSALVHFDLNQEAVTGGLGLAASRALFALTASMSLAILATQRRSLRRDDQPGLALIGFYAASVVSAVLAGHGGLGRNLLIAPLVVAAFTLGARQSPRNLLTQCRWILRVYTYGSLVALVVAPTWATYRIAFNQGAGFNSREYFGIGQLTGLTSSPNILGPIAVTALLCELVRVERRRWWPLHAVIAAVVLLLSESRISWLAALIAVPVLLFSQKAASRIKLSWAIGGVSAVIASIGIASLVSPIREAFLRLVAHSNLGSGDGRTAIFREAYRAFRTNEIIGYGPSVFDLNYRRTLGGNSGWIGQAHNQFFQSLAECGLVGFAALLLFLFFSYGRAKVRRGLAGLPMAMLVSLVVGAMANASLRNRVIDAQFLVVVIALLTFLPSGSAVESVDAEARPERQLQRA